MDKDKQQQTEESKGEAAPSPEKATGPSQRKKQSFKSSYEFSIRDCNEPVDQDQERGEPEGALLHQEEDAARDRNTQRSMCSVREVSDQSPMLFTLNKPKTAEPKIQLLPNSYTQIYLNPNLRDIGSPLQLQRPIKSQVSFEQASFSLNHFASQPYVCPMLNEAGQSSVSVISPHIFSQALLNVPEEEAAAVTYWRENYDPIFIHQLQNQVNDGDVRGFQRQALSRWYNQDKKGKRLTLYTRQVLAKNDQIQLVGNLNSLEILHTREDRWPCLVFRKHLMKIRIHINMIALKIIKKKSFEALTICVIIANCITLASSKADQEPSDTEVMIENIFQALYTIEMVIKILGMGFIFNKGAYLRDYFNMLDFFIVMSAYVSLLDQSDGSGSSEGISFKSLRAFRVLKPLRAVNNIPGLRLIVQAILSALPLLKDTIIVLMFFFLIFAIGGVNLFSGMLRQRCIHLETGSVQIDEDGDELICGTESMCEEGYFCGKRILNPNHDVTSFDNICWAMLAIFQCVTLEGWSDIMVLYQRVYTYYVFLFFVPLVFIGAFFLLNLTLAVINTSFNDVQASIKKNKAEAEVQLQKLFQQQRTQDELDEKLLKVSDNGGDKELDLKNLGIHQYFVAKRAALRIRAFAKKYYEEKRQNEQNNELLRDQPGTAENLEANLDLSLKRRQSMIISKNSQQKLPRHDSAFLSESGQSSHDTIERDRSYAANINVSPVLLFQDNKKVLGRITKDHSTVSMNTRQNLTPQKLGERIFSADFTQRKSQRRMSRSSLNSSNAGGSMQQIPDKRQMLNRNLAELDLQQALNQTITEEEQSEPLNLSVQQFLQNLQDFDIEGQQVCENDLENPALQASLDEILSPGLISKGGGGSSFLGQNEESAYKMSMFAGLSKMPSRTSVKVIMAFNDLRRAQVQEQKSLAQQNYTTLQPVGKINEATKILGHKSIAKDRYKEDWLKRLQEELDYDKMIGQQLQQPSVETKKADTALGPSAGATQLRILDNTDDDYDKSFVEDNQLLREITIQQDINSPIEQRRRAISLRHKKNKASINSVPNDNLANQKLNESSRSSIVTSVISSTSSIISELDKCAKEKKRVEKMKQRQARSKANLSRDMNTNIKRMLTAQDQDVSHGFLTLQQADPSLNDDTTFYGGQSFKQQIDVFSNLNEPTKPENLASFAQLEPTLVESQATKSKNRQKDIMASMRSVLHAQAKMKLAKVYSNVNIKDCVYDQSKPYESFNRGIQKIKINPAVQYNSSSQNDVFELRNKLKYNQRLKDLNRFITTHTASQTKLMALADAEKYDSDWVTEEQLGEDMCIRAPFHAWQLKSKLKVNEIDEVKFDDDDEDALILQQQPFETVMGVSQGDMLNHLPTKFLTRRSDIIVSSTLSISLTPLDNFIPTSFALLSRENIEQWIAFRNKFRSEGIQQQQLHNRTNQGLGQTNGWMKNIRNQDMSKSMNKVFSEDESDEVYQDVSNMRDVSKSQLSGVESLGNEEFKIIAVRQNFKHLPKTLLRVPIRPDLTGLLSEQDRRNYNIQKAKWEVEQRRIEKMIVPPRDIEYSEQEVEQMIAGNYWSDHSEDEDLDEDYLTGLDKARKGNLSNRSAAKSYAAAKRLGKTNEADKGEQIVLLGRTGLAEEFKLEQFEEAIAKVVAKSKKGINRFIATELSQLMYSGYIPESIRQEFNLPRDMQNRDMDFTEVRIMDSQISVKHPKWSGQDVLATSMNTDQARWVVKKINSVRVWPKGFMNVVKKGQAILKLHCMNPVFEHFMTLCVLLNTGVMSMDRYGISQDTEQILNNMNLVFTYVFIYEMVVKLMAIGPKKYSASKWNMLDGGVVLLSIVEIIVEQQTMQNQQSGSGLSAFKTVKVFRMFRVMRVARILRALHSMQVIIGVISRSFRSFMYVILLLILFVFIYALLGIQIYQGKYDFGPDEELPSGNFEEFGIAFVTVFTVLTMENWTEVMYSSMRSAKGSVFLKSLTAIYYVSWIFIGNFILLNLFLAILIDSFTSEQSESDVSAQTRLEAEKKQAEVRDKRLEELKHKRRKKLGTIQATRSLNQRRKGIYVRSSSLGPKLRRAKTFTGNVTFNETFEQVEDLDELDRSEIHNMLVKTAVIRDKSKKSKDWVIPDEIECQKSIYLFDREGIVRRTCYYVQQHRYFDRFIMFLIAVSSLQLAFETYIQDSEGVDGSNKVQVVNEIVGQIFTVFFLIEFIFKLIALGFVMDVGSYLRESWNQLDYFIVMTSSIDIMMSSSDIAALKILRMLRILRPLRVVSHNLQLKMIVTALLDAGGSIINVIVVILVVWLMFAIFAVNTYKGHFFYCSIDKYKYQDQFDCIDNGGRWLLYDSNFDNVSQAMMTLFVVSSLEGWPAIMNQAMDITKEDRGPKYQNNVKQAIFFIVFVLVGAFFFLNFFTGVLFLKYSEAQKLETAGFTEQQLKWREMQAMILKAKVKDVVTHKPMESQKWRLRAYGIVTSHVFEMGILLAIVLNMVQMAISYEGSNETVDNFMDLTNYIFTAIFIVEACLRIFVFGWAYFNASWNRFDFFVVVTSILDITLTAYQLRALETEGSHKTSQQTALSVAPQLARVLRVLRVSRVLRIANHYEGLQRLFNTIMMSVSGLMNVFMLLMLFFFVLAIMGQFMFSGVKSGVIINEYKNFTVFDRSFLLLFSISTGEDWNRIMYDCSKTLPDCIPGETCGSDLAPAYFIAVILLVTYVMLNLFILVIIQQFSKLYLDAQGTLQLFDRDCEIIVAAWIKFTSHHRCLKLKESQVQNFLKSIPAPLGFSDNNDSQLSKQVLKMGIKSEDGFIYFNELLYRVLRNQYGKFSLNKNMQIRELVTQYKLFNITLSMIKANSSNKDKNSPPTLDKFFLKVGSGGKDTVNPFLTQMYYRISFLAWYNTMLRLERDRQVKKLRQEQIKPQVKPGEEDQPKAKWSNQIAGGVLSTDEIEQDNSAAEPHYEAVVIDIEHITVYSVSSDEEAALDSQKDDQSNHNEVVPGENLLKSNSKGKQNAMDVRRASKIRMQQFHQKKCMTEGDKLQVGSRTITSQMNQYLSPDTNRMIRRIQKKPTTNSFWGGKAQMNETFEDIPKQVNQFKGALTMLKAASFETHPDIHIAPILSVAGETSSSEEVQSCFKAQIEADDEDSNDE